MKGGKRRIPIQEVPLAAFPFLALWLLLGLTIHPIVFTPWRVGQAIAPNAALALGFIPPAFTLFYSLLLFVYFRVCGRINIGAVATCALPALVCSIFMTPIT